MDIDNLPKLEFIDIPAGEFLMGDSNHGPIHRITLKSFRMLKYPVTQEQYLCVMGKNPSTDSSDLRLPVTNISWRDTQEFIKKLNLLCKSNYRLPSESEWEYACRAGTTTRFSFGDTPDSSKANFDSSDMSIVGKYPLNPWGLYDMHGNVWEWVQDSWNETYINAPTDGSAQETSNYNQRVLRGGSWLNVPDVLRSANRYWFNTDKRFVSLGFRLVQDITN